MEFSLAGIVRRHARERARAPMLTFEDRVIDYGDMHARASRVAQALLAEGVGPQDRIAFLDKNGPAYFEVLFGGAMVNAVNVAENASVGSGAALLSINPEEYQLALAEAEASLRTAEAQYRELLARNAQLAFG